MQNRQTPRIAAMVLLLVIFLLAILLPLSGGSIILVFPGIFILFFVVIVIVMIANATGQRGPRIQRPYSEQTAFPPPPPPDTMLVKCTYCNTSQPFTEKCVNCDAPLPKPGIY